MKIEWMSMRNLQSHSRAGWRIFQRARANLINPRRRFQSTRIDRAAKVDRQSKLQSTQGARSILRLRAGFAGNDRDGRGHVRESDRVTGLVPFLSAGPGASERVPPAIRKQCGIVEIAKARRLFSHEEHFIALQLGLTTRNNG